jgi:adenylylsulfate kinase
LGGLIVTVVVAYVITRKTELALTIGLGDTAVKLVAYYVHERLWLRVKFGLRKSTDYQI